MWMSWICLAATSLSTPLAQSRKEEVGHSWSVHSLLMPHHISSGASSRCIKNGILATGQMPQKQGTVVLVEIVFFTPLH